jgi:hypothetical protein
VQGSDADQRRAFALANEGEDVGRARPFGLDELPARLVEPKTKQAGDQMLLGRAGVPRLAAERRAR